MKRNKKFSHKLKQYHLNKLFVFHTETIFGAKIDPFILLNKGQFSAVIVINYTALGWAQPTQIIKIQTEKGRKLTLQRNEIQTNTFIDSSNIIGLSDDLAGIF